MKIRSYPKCSMHNLSLQFLDYFRRWHRAQKQCGPITKERNIVGSLKIKIIICVGHTINGLLVPLCTCPTLRREAFMCMGPFLMIGVGLVECI